MLTGAPEIGQQGYVLEERARLFLVTLQERQLSEAPCGRHGLPECSWQIAVSTLISHIPQLKYLRKRYSVWSSSLTTSSASLAKHGALVESCCGFSMHICLLPRIYCGPPFRKFF